MEEQLPEKNEKKEKGSKGKETLYRVAYRNQITLIQIADNKANLIISINTMIISSIIAISGYGMVAERFQYDKANIIIPLALIMLSCLVSAVFAIQAAKPKLIKNMALEKDKTKSSLLFFGVISQYTQAEYLERMNALLTSDKDIYDTMNIDLHNQGMILSRKYSLINRAYRVFMFGFILSVWIFLAFLVAR
ncbi:MAG: DUF5706 domain-containing protein [Cytophagales bacterium]|nr:DUF5706 domain-containing protein [Cytophagales bacterium]